MNTVRTIDGNGLGRIEMRTQNQEDEQFRAALTREGHVLKVESVDALTFRIVCVPDGTKKAGEPGKIDVESLGEEDARTIAAQRGIRVKPGDTRVEIINRLMKAEGRI